MTKESYGAQRKFLQGKQCDSVMNYPFLNAIINFVTKGDADAFYKTVMEILEMFPSPSVKCLMNSLSTHDTARIINRLGADVIPDKKLHADTKLSEKEKERGREGLAVAAMLQYTLPGIPCIYYGDEAGLTGDLDPYNRCCYPWGRKKARMPWLPLP